MPLASYKHKDDLKDIATALALDQQGTIAELFSRCQDHLATHPQLLSDPRFASLFAMHQTCTQAHSGETNDIPPFPTLLPFAMPHPQVLLLAQTYLFLSTCRHFLTLYLSPHLQVLLLAHTFPFAPICHHFFTLCLLPHLQVLLLACI